jgi:hypothetical protein
VNGRAGCTRSVEPARARAAETPSLGRTLSELVNQAYGLTTAEIELVRFYFRVPVAPAFR